MAPSKKTIEPADFVKLGEVRPAPPLPLPPFTDSTLGAKANLNHVPLQAAKLSLRKGAIGCHGTGVGIQRRPTRLAEHAAVVAVPHDYANTFSGVVAVPHGYACVVEGFGRPCCSSLGAKLAARSDLGSPVRVADATEDVRADLALRGLPTTDEFVSISTNLRHSAMVDDPFRIALEVLMASVARSAGKVANRTSVTMSSGGDKAKLREQAAMSSLPRVAGSRSRSSR
ncbi:hypothetical protein MVLG_01684 [Microbotryum lychnidis-dioicae p1A1 Lamole]|uniref:Uncharacterized protein n=1 Tax=Microbotryum lychnidis-dioicae (strain p1A1 Lamole / MvSl-1064) TaxID=683840 RepID=U5H2V2_USTV1|nr:hypothetical protein MVLG_01684 [Microbotryum lychnidis-dioicae p1A1 Lamole]|eukprot:KDE08205.1 hypothetical protein MVLG_01684 [Microbotryum lychnidis-dioicae p1A1 Lamole]